jgi:hypothetical protein
LIDFGIASSNGVLPNSRRIIGSILWTVSRDGALVGGNYHGTLDIIYAKARLGTMLDHVIYSRNYKDNACSYKCESRKTHEEIRVYENPN